MRKLRSLSLIVPIRSGFAALAARVAAGFLILLGFNWAGTYLSELLALPLPGPLVGMVALTAFLALHKGPAAGAVIACGERMLRHYALFFIPAGVGVMTRFGALWPQFAALAVALVGSSLLSLVVTSLVMRALLRRPA
jgi:holin-like protein